MTTAQRMTYRDLLAQPDDGCLHELVRGEILRMPPPKGRHGNTEAILVGAIDRYLFGHALQLGWHPDQGTRARQRLVGCLASGKAGIRFSLPDDPDQIRGVDVLYLTVEQVARLEEVIEREYIPEVPALAAEIISPSEAELFD